MDLRLCGDNDSDVSPECEQTPYKPWLRQLLNQEGGTGRQSAIINAVTQPL